MILGRRCRARWTGRGERRLERGRRLIARDAPPRGPPGFVMGPSLTASRLDRLAQVADLLACWGSPRALRPKRWQRQRLTVTGQRRRRGVSSPGEATPGPADTHCRSRGRRRRCSRQLGDSGLLPAGIPEATRESPPCPDPQWLLCLPTRTLTRAMGVLPPEVVRRRARRRYRHHKLRRGIEPCPRRQGRLLKGATIMTTTEVEVGGTWRCAERESAARSSTPSLRTEVVSVEACRSAGR